MACIPKSKNNPASAVDKILSACLPEGAAVAVGLSGGMDSVSLLEATLPLQGRWKILVCHVNHGISLHADSWERFCRRLCEKKNIPIIVCRVPTPPVVASEDWARQQRMAAFAGLSVKACLPPTMPTTKRKRFYFACYAVPAFAAWRPMRPCAHCRAHRIFNCCVRGYTSGGTMSPVTLGGKNCLGWKMKTTTICHGGEIF